MGRRRQGIRRPEQRLSLIHIYGAREFAAYPLDVYGTAILKFCTYIVPYALFQYYPLTYLLGRTASPLCALAPLAAPLFALPCWIVWRVGVRKYQSAGS